MYITVMHTLTGSNITTNNNTAFIQRLKRPVKDTEALLVGLVPRSSVSLPLGFSAMLTVSLVSRVSLLLEVCTIICMGVYRHLLSGHEISRLEHCPSCIKLVQGRSHRGGHGGRVPRAPYHVPYIKMTSDSLSSELTFDE